MYALPPIEVFVKEKKELHSLILVLITESEGIDFYEFDPWQLPLSKMWGMKLEK